MTEYNIRTVIPSLSSYVYLNELTNKNLLDINKFISSNDNIGLDIYLSNLLPKNINIYDKFFLLLFLRYKCVGEEIKLYNATDNTTLSLNIGAVLERLFNHINKGIEPFVYKNMQIVFKEPTLLYFEKYVDLIKDIVEDILIDSKSVKDAFSIKESVLKLKPEIIDLIIKHIKLNNNNIFYLSSSDKLSSLNATFYNNSCFNVIKLFLTYNVSNIYLKMFHMTEKLNINYSDFLKLTPLESDVLLNIYKSIKNIK